MNGKFDALKSQGYSDVDAARAALNIQNFVLGPRVDASGEKVHDLFGYAYNDRDTQTLGEKISKFLGLCNAGG
jgi:hypothetical protein